VLWRLGISGDRPIVLVSASNAQGVGLLRTLAQALRVWSWGGVGCDLVMVNAEAHSYTMPLAREIAGLRERYVAEIGASPAAPNAAGFHVVQPNELSPEELRTLRALARIELDADGRPLAHHVQDWREPHDEALAARRTVARAPVSGPLAGRGASRVSAGEFVDGGREYAFDVNHDTRPRRPWVNVMANPEFGTQASEAGGGHTWALNSRMNQLTPWSNDPVADPAGEWWLLQDARTREVWSIMPSAWGDATANYRVVHGQGYTITRHRHRDLEVEVTCCVDADTAIKEIRVRLVNRGARSLALRALGIVEWQLGAGRSDRASVTTSRFRHPLPARGSPRALRDASALPFVAALLATQGEASAGFGGGTAFLATTGTTADLGDWTTDRRECFDSRGFPVVPQRYAQRSGRGLDPCAAMALPLRVEPGARAEYVFLLGYGSNVEAAQALAVGAAGVASEQRLARARDAWDALLGAATVQTPDPLFDAMVNRWLLYQAVSCRLWAKAGFYQAGGAFGFRDQLQDAMALAWAAPQSLRRQILLSASRQFEEGDVQHWWHPPTGAGVRTRSSDDLLWLPYACAHFVQATGDASVLDESVAFIAGAAIPDGHEDAYYVPTVSANGASVYEHCARAIDRSLVVGAHGLPLIGIGDWNDGMNRVGHHGHGESVWLAWFLCRIVADFAPIARSRGDQTRVQRWEHAARDWRDALQRDAWDGDWYKRAYFDDGSPLGSHVNAECRIDLIAQAWAVLSDAAPPSRQRAAMAAAHVHLVDRTSGLIKLLTPPLVRAQPDAGYIQAYPPGVRENGGQYSHAGVWALMAQAKLGDAETAYRYFSYLSPAHRTRDPAAASVYAIEPYVLAGDIYSEPPYVGRGGWSWYTGSAAWLHRAAIETLFGLCQRGETVSFEPRLPPQWDQAVLRLRREGRTLTVVFVRPGTEAARTASALPGATVLHSNEAVTWSTLATDATVVVTLPVRTAQVTPRTAAVR
jgi:cyclic beta-1,2-glucan synthetase